MSLKSPSATSYVSLNNFWQFLAKIRNDKYSVTSQIASARIWKCQAKYKKGGRPYSGCVDAVAWLQKRDWDVEIGNQLDGEPFDDLKWRERKSD